MFKFRIKSLVMLIFPLTEDTKNASNIILEISIFLPKASFVFLAERFSLQPKPKKESAVKMVEKFSREKAGNF